MLKKYPVFSVLAVLAALLLTPSCAKKIEPAAASAQEQTNSDGAALAMAAEYMPLNLGNSWTYRRDMLGEKGSFKITIEKKDKGFYFDNQGGMFRIDSIGLRDATRYLLKNPIAKGSQWRAQVRFNVAEHFEVMDDAAVVAVPAGTFKNCVIVKSITRIGTKAETGKVIVNRLTYAPRVGMIRAETWVEDDKGNRASQVLFELESYVLP